MLRCGTSYKMSELCKVYIMKRAVLGLGCLVLGGVFVWFAFVHKGNVVNDETIHGACAAGNYELVQHLLQRGIGVDIRDGLDQTALLHAAWWGHEKVIELLLQRGADVNAKSELGFTALYWAVNHGQRPVIAMLLKAGAKANIKSLNDWTALHEAAVHGNDDIYATLVAAGADADATDRWGNTPREFKARSAAACAHAEHNRKNNG